MDTELTNQEAQYGQPSQETPQVAPAQEEPAAPEDLAAAFAALRDNDNAAAQTPVATGDVQGRPAAEPAAGEGTQPDVSGIPDGTVGTTSVDLSGFDPNAYGQQVLKDIRQLVIQTKRKEWNDKGYKPFSVQDLARRDERTGRIYYVNPDDGQQEWERPGYAGIDREKATAWVNSFNQELNNKWKQECSEAERNYVQQAMPLFRLAAFAPTYQSMSQAERDVIDELTEPYAIRNNRGDVIGFNCDLDQMARSAKAIASRWGNAAPAQQNNVRQPVTDARGGAGGNTKTNTNRVPKDLNDAFEILWERERQENK